MTVVTLHLHLYLDSSVFSTHRSTSSMQLQGSLALCHAWFDPPPVVKHARRDCLSYSVQHCKDILRITRPQRTQAQIRRSSTWPTQPFPAHCILNQYFCTDLAAPAFKQFCYCVWQRNDPHGWSGCVYDRVAHDPAPRLMNAPVPLSKMTVSFYTTQTEERTSLLPPDLHPTAVDGAYRASLLLVKQKNTKITAASARPRALHPLQTGTSRGRTHTKPAVTAMQA